MKMDWILLLLIILLVATLIAFFAGVFPYPFGFFVLLAFIGLRFVHLRRKSAKQNMPTRRD